MLPIQKETVICIDNELQKLTEQISYMDETVVLNTRFLSNR